MLLGLDVSVFWDFVPGTNKGKVKVPTKVTLPKGVAESPDQ